MLQVKLLKSSAEYTVNRTLHRKLLGKHMVFVNSEISELYSVISDGLTRFKYRTTRVHISSSDSIICTGQGQLTASAFYLKVSRKQEAVPDMESNRLSYEKQQNACPKLGSYHFNESDH